MRDRFDELIARQLSLFETDHAQLIRDCDQAERAYDLAAKDEAEERYGDFLDLVETATEALADIRDHYSWTLTRDIAIAYEQAFNRAVLKWFPRFALGLEP
ncbi:MAG: hypothetical protein H0U03_05155 [Actinobacteria bacterium]|nr:hypothetical protein [Actinomycetota bacterium]